VLGLLTLTGTQGIELLSSDALLFEIERNPNRFLRRAREIRGLATKVISPVELIGELERW